MNTYVQLDTEENREAQSKVSKSIWFHARPETTIKGNLGGGMQ